MQEVLSGGRGDRESGEVGRGDKREAGKGDDRVVGGSVFVEVDLANVAREDVAPELEEWFAASTGLDDLSGTSASVA
mgnify:CR=1 FL=1